MTKLQERVSTVLFIQLYAQNPPGCAKKHWPPTRAMPSLFRIYPCWSKPTRQTNLTASSSSILTMTPACSVWSRPAAWTSKTPTHALLHRRRMRNVARSQTGSLITLAPWVTPRTRLLPSGHSSPRTNDHQALPRSEEHTSELQSRFDLVCRL